MWYWWLIGFAAVCAVTAVVLWLVLGRKKPEKEPVVTHKHLIEASRARLKALDRQIDVLTALPHNAPLVPQLKDLQDKIRYLSPSARDEVRAIDETIAERLDAMRATPAEGGSTDVGAIAALLAERGRYTD